MGHLHLTPLTVFLAKSGMRDSLRIIDLVCSMVEVDNALKHSRKLEIVIHEKCGREFGMFGV